METKRIILSLYVVFTSALWVNAQESTHWQCDIYKYQYDMTVYFKLQQGEEAITNLSDYEVAAFVGDECRGISEIQTVKTTDNTTAQYGYLRVRSNLTEGETVDFKAYQSSTGKLLLVEETISFKNLDMIGKPSAPFTLTLFNVIKGDVNNDGFINANDIVDIINYIMGKSPKKFYKEAADMNNDNVINIADIIMIANNILAAN